MDGSIRLIKISIIILVFVFSWGGPTARWIISGLLILSVFIFLIRFLIVFVISEKRDCGKKSRDDKIRHLYPNAFSKYIQDKKLHAQFSKWSKDERKAFFSIRESEWKNWEAEEQTRKEIIREQQERSLAEIQEKAPNGLKIWLHTNNYYARWLDKSASMNLIDVVLDKAPDGLISISQERVIDKKQEIFRLEDCYVESERMKTWMSVQNEYGFRFSSLRQILKEFGCLRYPIPYKLLDENGQTKEQNFWLYQIFACGYCLEEDLDYSLCPHMINRGKYLLGLNPSSGWAVPMELIEDKITKALISIPQKEKDVAILFYDEKLKERISQYITSILDKNSPVKDILRFPDWEFENFMEDCSKFLMDAKIPIYYYSDIETKRTAFNHQKLVVITNYVLTNEIVNISQKIWELFPKERPHLAFLSIYKNYSRDEMQSLIDKKKKSILEEEEKRRKEQELLDSIPSKVEDWETLSMSGGLKISYLLDYYPTTLNIDADDDEWDNRWIVWSFKNDPEKTSKNAHQRALERVIPKFADLLRKTFGDEALKYLSLVCIPASTPEKNEARYKEFSERLCRETCMENGFEHIRVTRTRVAKHEGGKDENVNYSVDDSFFNGKRVILLDDIITNGNSMRIAKAILQKKGAKVICGLAVGKTRHTRHNLNIEEI